MGENEKSISKFLSLVLRHKPETINLSLDPQGWASVDELIAKANLHKVPLNPDILRRVVETNDKKRFIFSDDQQRIRANQGHSIEVNLQLTATAPPHQLFHGTAERNIESIRTQGLLKRERHHVHLSTDHETAKAVGGRYGKPVVLVINAKGMHENGFKFYQAENGVWLTDHVPPDYIDSI